MHKKTPYDIVKSRYVTEKARVLGELKDRKSNPSIAKSNAPKYVFLVDLKANKTEIAHAVEQIYAEKNIKVKAVNTIITKPKQKRVRGKIGYKSAFKKAVVTLAEGDDLGETV